MEAERGLGGLADAFDVRVSKLVSSGEGVRWEGLQNFSETIPSTAN